jgi:hypothetical protein
LLHDLIRSVNVPSVPSAFSLAFISECGTATSRRIKCDNLSKSLESLLTTMNRILPPAQHPFRGIAEKLNRSHENIKNLEAEIARFFKESEYPLLTNDKAEIIPEAVEYHRKLPVPLRFSVLSGEVIHHLRSCLDHIVWHFSSGEYRREHMGWIEFPILKDRPSPTHVSWRPLPRGPVITRSATARLLRRAVPMPTAQAPFCLPEVQRFW